MGPVFFGPVDRRKATRPLDIDPQDGIHEQKDPPDHGCSHIGKFRLPGFKKTDEGLPVGGETVPLDPKNPPFFLKNPRQKLPFGAESKGPLKS